MAKSAKFERYKTIWKPMSLNKKFWGEVLIGRSSFTMVRIAPATFGMTHDHR